jgi:hypothetical protein
MVRNTRELNEWFVKMTLKCCEEGLDIWYQANKAFGWDYPLFQKHFREYRNYVNGLLVREQANLAKNFKSFKKKELEYAD